MRAPGELTMLPPHLSQRLEQALRGLEYGTIQLVIHDAQVVRIERLERIKLTDQSEATPTTFGRPTPPEEVRHERAAEA